MKQFWGILIIIFVFSFVLAAGFVIVKEAGASDVSNAKLIGALFGRTPAPSVAAMVNLADAKSNFVVPVALVTPTATEILPTMPTKNIANPAPGIRRPADEPRPQGTGNPVANSPMAGWSNYHESQYGIVMQYPADWHAHDAIPLGGPLTFSSVLENAYGGALPSGAARIIMYRSQESAALAFQEDAMGAVTESSSTASVAGIRCLEVRYDLIGGAVGEKNITVYLSHDGFLYRIILDSRGEAEFENTFEEFLSVFRFG